jgi:UDP-N-acetylmuramyl pentapeptide phosphotransferase/UDP-N-acetylglucosamine-1-phosphate transferase
VLAIITVLAAFCLSAAGVRWAVGWLTARNLVAVENARSSHRGKVPQGGGAPLLAAAGLALIAVWPWSPWSWTSWHTAVIPAAAGLALLSGINDRTEIPFPLRLLAHVAAAVCLVAVLPTDTLILGGVLPWAIERAGLVLGLVWFMNLYNFMDGIDGIAGVETLTLTAGALAVAAVAGVPAPLEGLALAVAGAAAGFLLWNWHPARIFMGDVGSIPIGFICGGLLLHLASAVSLAAAIILPLYYVTDATLTLLRRLRRGEKIWQAHRSHAYQRASRGLGSHSAVVRRIAICNATLVLAALAALWSPIPALAAAVAAVATLMFSLEQAATQAHRHASR